MREKLNTVKVPRELPINLLRAITMLTFLPQHFCTCIHAETAKKERGSQVPGGTMRIWVISFTCDVYIVWLNIAFLTLYWTHKLTLMAQSWNNNCRITMSEHHCCGFWVSFSLNASLHMLTHILAFKGALLVQCNSKSKYSVGNILRHSFSTQFLPHAS